MARTKERFMSLIEDLAEESGYDMEELLEHFYAYADSCHEDGEPVDWSYFEDVTMEHDW